MQQSKPEPINQQPQSISTFNHQSMTMKCLIKEIAK